MPTKASYKDLIIKELSAHINADVRATAHATYNGLHEPVFFDFNQEPDYDDWEVEGSLQLYVYFKQADGLLFERVEVPLDDINNVLESIDVTTMECYDAECFLCIFREDQTDEIQSLSREELIERMKAGFTKHGFTFDTDNG